MSKSRYAVVVALGLTGSWLAACSADDATATSKEKKSSKAKGDDDASGDDDATEKPDASAPPTETQLAQVAELGTMVAYLRENTAWPYPLDWTAIEADGANRVLSGDGSELAYFDALYHVFIQVPEGHQGLYMKSGCGTVAPFTGSTSTSGACGRPHARGIVITQVKAGNSLGLAKGDLVTKIAGHAGKAALVALADRPSCTFSSPSTSYREAAVAASFTNLVKLGEELEIEAPNGTKRVVKMTAPKGAPGAEEIVCQDPFGRATNIAVESSLRPDGVAVIRLPGFTDAEQPFPDADAAKFAAYKEAFETKIQAAFDKVKTAKAIVWDIRGNGGGITQVGLDILSGTPGAKADPLSYCNARVPKSDPPTFSPGRYAEYLLAPGGRFAYAGKVAILTDGFDYSASDYFALAAKLRTKAILVGASTAGGFGATSESRDFPGPPEFSVAVDLNRCALASDDTFLEGKSVEPHVAVDYDPKDLAAGKDTILERAVVELGPL